MITALLLMTLAQTVGQDTTYFQQGVAYRIEATLNDSTSVLNGRARLTYTNRSPRTIDTLYFHLHLNAFRPNSAWSKRELQFGNRRFQDLGPDDHAYERLKRVMIAGRRVVPRYPGGDDSTVVAIVLPTALSPGSSTVLLMDWDARLSTLPRRQGRRGRHHDFAHWYPRIAVFDRDGWQVQPLLPQGEFYGEFGTFDVTLDLAQDQVVGATGVPVSGDPGWARANAKKSAPVRYQRTAYPSRAAEPLGLLTRQPAAGRKQIRWRAEQVHHFAWTTSPQYIYESGQHRNVTIHVLYQPGDSAWANGVTVQRTAQALAHYDSLFGPYPYAQITNVHRIESGGTEFPMMVMNGSPSFGLILHEVGHQWMHGLFGNNEWREGWLDEGFTSFTNSWHTEVQQGPTVWLNDMRGIVALEQAGLTEPIARLAQDFADFNMYGAMTYTKPSLVLRMLRDLVGEQNTRIALKDFYRHNRFRHVREADLKASFERATGVDLGWFFEQWLHTTGKLDYGLGMVTTDQRVDGTWRTRVEVIRTGDNWMPVTLKVGSETRRLDSQERSQIITIDSAQRPTDVTLDPDQVLIDIDPTNNRKVL